MRATLQQFVHKDFHQKHSAGIQGTARCRAWSCLAVAAITATVGCGRRSSLEKVVVAGNVSYEGKPLENGEIRFYPIEGTAGPVSGAPIRAGRFEASAKGGVPVGKHRVVIEGYRTRSTPVSATDPKLVAIPGGLEGPREQFLPQKYNKQSELVVDIDSTSDAATRSFTLEP